ncbi:MAG: hypothetical protein IJS96_10105 [Schwartzia sp.]|nr:hypothetical protein [Schwartzia sp. (in: firmicutes)]
MAASASVKQRIEQIFDMIRNYEYYDERKDNTENYLLNMETLMPYENRDEVIQGVAEKLRGDSLASKSFLENIIGDEHEGTLVLAHDEWVEAAIAKADQVAKAMGVGWKPMRFEYEPAEINAAATFAYLDEKYYLDRFFPMGWEDYFENYGVICKMKLSPSVSAARYLPSHALKCESKNRNIHRFLMRLGFQSWQLP